MCTRQGGQGGQLAGGGGGEGILVIVIFILGLGGGWINFNNNE